ncbi:MAG: prenyltransferase [Acidobacteria bacterium]|nr:MAG: prenyltransferase [Acidobacteriota bacterium]
MLPGTVVAALLIRVPLERFAGRLALGLLSACLIASANYVINEWLDAEFDRFHPVKRNRPSVAGGLEPEAVYAEYGLLLAAGLALAWLISPFFFASASLLGVMGVLYNVRPFRSKDRVYLDVLSESVNNPIRLLLGWFVVSDWPLPPSSLLMAYWMGGAFLMGVKRYSEYRFLEDVETAVFYALCASFFLGVFLVKYRIELLLSLPLLACMFAWYLWLGMKPDSPAQRPEHLYRETSFISFVALVVVVMAALLFVDIPSLRWFLNNSFISAP